MAAEAGLREALDLADMLVARTTPRSTYWPRSDGGGGEACVGSRQPRALRDSALDFDVLVAAGGEEQPADLGGRPSSALGRCRSRFSTSGFFVDLTSHTTGPSRFRSGIDATSASRLFEAFVLELGQHQRSPNSEATNV